jgi:hypothetical protein
MTPIIILAIFETLNNGHIINSEKAAVISTNQVQIHDNQPIVRAIAVL